MANAPNKTSGTDRGKDNTYIGILQSLDLPKQVGMCWNLTEIVDKVRAAVGQVEDPETGMTFADMEMITSVTEESPGVMKIEFVPSSPFCPIAFKLATDIKNAALKVQGVKKALVYCRGHQMEQRINEMTNKE